MERSHTRWILTSLLVGTVGLTGCQNDNVAKDDVEKIVSDRLAEAEGKRLAAAHEQLQEENLALKNELELLKEELAAAQASLATKQTAVTTRPATAATKKPVTATEKEKQMADLRAKLRGGSGAK